ncbi:minor capsid protein [Aerococcaceae bacterium zg-ZJ1578]|uniref:minor capsid protein n=1 Tax=Aerococcaceae TaxID=186827 RepID=UPI0013BBC399|nr:MULTISPECIES: minor capsid protein [unclassified Facklamia]MBK0348230.1 minor capsid protein [Aerococcaceae bacterium zg-1578]MBR7928473.1 minor capsid protein [Aerococcaceae bacterium zg-ZUI334]QQD66506.1 minor capsid protein [Aerococcaceae bacterium zg-252]NEW64254.1 capsid protein [Facklamia sp. 252]NEW68769.1 capsid protein [Facklamia sp. 253]
MLIQHLNTLSLPLVARLDFLSDQEDLVVYSLPGGKVEKSYMDGTTEMSLPFEIAIKSKDQKTCDATLWLIESALSDPFLELPSEQNAYLFLGLTVDKPFLNEKDEQGFFVYVVDVTAKLEINGGIN